VRVGDLVRVKNDLHCWGGFGIILALKRDDVKVYWVDEWNDHPVDWNRKWILEVINKS
tara:strand:+ start:1171 stop:1344 length:174 start_codon:yes stop_codon:yes gene_type:complete